MMCKTGPLASPEVGPLVPLTGPLFWKEAHFNCRECRKQSRYFTIAQVPLGASKSVGLGQTQDILDLHISLSMAILVGLRK